MTKKTHHDFNRHQNIDTHNIPRISNISPSFTSKDYLFKLFYLHAIGLSIILLASALQAIAMLTNDWYVLNVNEYIPTSKGGLWSYCFVSSTGFLDQYTCMTYEELPNFAVFVNERLYTSRILLLCNAGFLVIVLFIETLGMFSLFCVRASCRRFDEILETKKSRLRLTSTPTASHINNMHFSNCNPGYNAELNQLRSDLLKAKPTGYASYMSTTLVNLVAASMELVLQVAGFVLFDAYIKQLLSFNTVFLAYRSYSYWMMIVSMAFVFFYWIFKIFTTRYVMSLNKRLIGLKDTNTFPSIVQGPIYPNGTNYNTISRFSQQNVIEENQFYGDSQRHNDYMAAPSFRKSFVFDTEISNDDELANSTFSSIQNYNNYLFSGRQVEMGRIKNLIETPDEAPGQMKKVFKNPISNIANGTSINKLEEDIRNSPVSIMRF